MKKSVLITSPARARSPCHKNSRKQAYDRLRLHQLSRLAQGIVDHSSRIDPQRVIDSGKEFDGMDGIVSRARGGFVALPVDRAAGDAAAGDQACVTIRPVVAAIGAVGIA